MTEPTTIGSKPLTQPTEDAVQLLLYSREKVIHMQTRSDSDQLPKTADDRAKTFSFLGSVIAILMSLHWTAGNAAVVQIAPADLLYNAGLNFDSEVVAVFDNGTTAVLVPGAAHDINIDGSVDFLPNFLTKPFVGMTFGERIETQDLAFSDLAGNPIPPSTSEPIFDRLSQSSNADPGFAVNVIPGNPNQNLALLFDNEANTNVIAGLGPLGFDVADGRGEGAIAATFFGASPFEFGFSVFGTNPVGSNRIVIDFFDFDANLLDTLTLSPIANGPVAFRDTGLVGIAGFSIWNTDNGGLGFNNFRFTVLSTAIPAPATFSLLVIGLFGLRVAMRS